MEPIKDIKLDDVKGFSDLLQQMKESGGFVAKKMGIGLDILEKMQKDKESKTILSFPACLMSTGARGLLVYMVKNKMVDAVITTCGTMDHDLARVWKDYYHGSFSMDDKKLHQEGINREGNILIPNECYGGILEDKMQKVLQEIYDNGKRDLAPYELVWEFGKSIDKEERKEDSLTYWAWKNKIPVFIPGPTDGAWGYHIWMFWQDEHKDFNLNVLKDDQELSNLIYEDGKMGALMIGGGISKHHTIWWNQFRDGLDYAVYITTAPEWDGSLSGARLREAVSWGKIKENAKFVTIEGDATVILPVLLSGLKEKMTTIE